MSKYKVNSESLTAVANAIRAKTGNDEPLEFPDEFVSEIASISGGGGYTLDDIIEHNFTGSVTYTGTNIRGGTFQGSQITEIHLPNITNQLQNAQASHTFRDCAMLRTIDMPSLTSFTNAGYVFHGCSSLESAYFPELTAPGSFMFQNCTVLKYLVMPKVKNLSSNMIAHSNAANQMNLLALDCGSPDRTGTDNVVFTSNAFNSEPCQTIIIRQTILAQLQNNNANCLPTNFRSGGAGGTIYIPKALYDHLGDGTSLDYKAATNWSVFDTYGTITWAKIEGSQYETHYADGTVIPT